MELKISNLLAVKSAKVEVEGITILDGPNGAGKTTILQTLAGLLSGEALPYQYPDGRPCFTTLEVGKQQIPRRGQKEGMATFGNLSYLASNKRVAVSGGDVHPIFTGQARWSRLDYGQRAAILKAVLPADTFQQATPEVIRAALLDGGVPKDHADHLLFRAESKTIPKLLDLARNDWTDLRIKWEETAQEGRYGKLKGASWVPKNYTLAQCQVDAGCLMADLEDAQSEYDRLVRLPVAGEYEVAQLKHALNFQEDAKLLAELEAALEVADRAVKENDLLAPQEPGHQGIPVFQAELKPKHPTAPEEPIKDADRKCRFCGGAVVHECQEMLDSQDSFAASKEKYLAEYDAWKERCAKIDERNLARKAKFDADMARLEEEKAAEHSNYVLEKRAWVMGREPIIKAFREAEAALNEYQKNIGDKAVALVRMAKIQAGSATHKQVKEARERVERISCHLNAVNAYTSCQELHTAMQDLDKAIIILGEDGLQRTLDGMVVDKFSSWLENATKVVGLPPIACDSDLSLFFDGFLQKSQAELALCDFVVALVLAMHTDRLGVVVLLDGIDTVKDPLFDGLMSLIGLVAKDTPVMATFGGELSEGNKEWPTATYYKITDGTSSEGEVVQWT